MAAWINKLTRYIKLLWTRRERAILQEKAGVFYECEKALLPHAEKARIQFAFIEAAIFSTLWGDHISRSVR